jgi:hypothetical protein
VNKTSARAARLLGLGVAILLLAISAWSARSALQALANGKRDAAAAAIRLQSLQALVPEMAQREEFSRLAVKANQQAEAMGFDPTRWAERRVNRTAGPITREDASDLLGQIDTDSGARFFAADGFELSVTQRGAGLFTPPSPDDKGLVMALSGTLHFPLTKRP